MTRYLSFTLILCLLSVPVRAQIVVFTAASMADAVSEIAREFTQATDLEIMVAAAASSTLARQIEHGSGADLFISANRDWLEYLDGLQRIDRYNVDTLAYNRLVLISRKTDHYLGKVGDDAELIDLMRWLGPDQRFALGDPSHVPAGQYAKQALQAAGWWQTIEPYMAPTSSVRAALALVDTGNAPVGIVYATDAQILPDVQIIADIAPEIHPTILYPIALLPDAQPAARRFYRFLLSRQAADILHRFGFIPAD